MSSQTTLWYELEVPSTPRASASAASIAALRCSTSAEISPMHPKLRQLPSRELLEMFLF